MSYEISDELQRAISQRMASGIYSSEEQLLSIALDRMSEYEQAIADLKEGLEDERSGRLRTLRDADRDIRDELGFTV